MIIKYSNNLTHIQLRSYSSIETQFLKKFFDKFGHKLISIINCHQFIEYTIFKAPNIELLTDYSFDSQLSQIKFNRLKKFCVEDLWEEYLDSFELFIENNTKTLKHLDIRCTEFEDKESVKKLLKIISKPDITKGGIAKIPPLSLTISEIPP